MKINIIKTVTALIMVGMISIPVLTFAQEGFTPDVGPDGIGGANSFVPDVGPGNIGGANTFIPDVGPSNTGGGDSNSNPSANGFVPNNGSNESGFNASGGADSNSNPSANGFIPQVGDAGIGGADSFIPDVGPGGIGGGDSAPVVPPTTDDNSNNSRSSGGSSSRNRSSNTNTLPTTNNVIASCTYINDYLTYGSANNSTEVTKLQSFLKETENINVDVNGTFDQKTFNAVKAFQVKYSNDILAPWGQTIPSGRVFYTTKKKINEIFCKTNFALTPAQLAEIATVKRNTENLAAAARVAPASTVAPAASTINTPVEEITPAENVIDSSEIGSTETNANALTASAADAPSTNVIIRFFKWLFGF